MNRGKGILMVILTLNFGKLFLTRQLKGGVDVYTTKSCMATIIDQHGCDTSMWTWFLQVVQRGKRWRWRDLRPRHVAEEGRGSEVPMAETTRNGDQMKIQ